MCVFVRILREGISLLDLKKLLEGRIPSVDFRQTLDLTLLSGDIVSGTGEAIGVISNHSGYIVLEGSVSVYGRAVCARCSAEFDLSFDIPLCAKLTDKLANEDEDEFLIIVDSKLDLSSYLESTVVLELPSRFLCREDCLGLCPKCGCDLNRTSCSCQTVERDSRWDVLKNYFE